MAGQVSIYLQTMSSLKSKNIKIYYCFPNLLLYILLIVTILIHVGFLPSLQPRHWPQLTGASTTQNALQKPSLSTNSAMPPCLYSISSKTVVTIGVSQRTLLTLSTILYTLLRQSPKPTLLWLLLCCASWQIGGAMSSLQTFVLLELRVT